MEALSFWGPIARLARRILMFPLLCVTAGQVFAHPALIPLPTSVAWHDGNVSLSAETLVEGRGKAAPAAAYVARELGLSQGARGTSRIRLALVPASRIPNPEAYHLRVGGNGVLIEASDPRGLFYGTQTLLQLVEKQPNGERTVAAVEIAD